MKKSFFVFALIALSFVVIHPSFADDFKETKFDNWRVNCLINEEEGIKSCNATTSYTNTEKNYPFPYNDLWSETGLLCDSSGYKAIVYMFNHMPILTESERASEFKAENAVLEAKFDERVFPMKIFQLLGDNFFAVSDASQAIYLYGVASSSTSTHTLKIPWHGLGDVVMEYDLSGAKEAIKEALKRCKN